MSQPGDAEEREADRMAEAALRSPPDRPARDAAHGAGAAKRASAIARRAAPKPAGVEISDLPAPLGALRGAGTPLAPLLRADLEPRFGADFSAVRIHTGNDATRLAKSFGAEAFTVGRDIVFGGGRFAPGTPSGRALLAHELAHVVQRGTKRTPLVMRSWESAPECATQPTDKWIQRVVVEQERPQSATLYWSDGSIESDMVSTGKGQCCVDTAANPDGVACDVTRSRTTGSNCTPITRDTGYPIWQRVRDHGGVMFWSEFAPAARAIALHEYSPVDGTPLSHGCVRMHRAHAIKVFCGARQNRTMVQVQGFARPRCDWPALQDEWAGPYGDFQTAGRDLPDGDARERRHILNTRAEVNAALGRTFTQSEYRALGVDDIPRCARTGPQRTVEEARLNTDSASGTPSAPARILSSSGFDARVVPFLQALSGASSLTTARTAVERHGRDLWSAATARAQAATPDTDDRPLYWTRLELTRAIRQWQPRAFTLSAADREDLIQRLERTSRGMTTATFSSATGVKRILVSGFDPFQLDDDPLQPGIEIARGNPSGAAVLALDNQPINNGTVQGQIQGVIFPVRFADFDAGLAERFFGPYLNNTQPVEMIMTISQGGSADFEVEEHAGRRRSSTAPDNLRVRGGGSRTAPIVPPGVTAGDEFIPTSLPAAVRTALGRTTPLTGESEVTEIPTGATAPVHRPGGPTPGSTSVEGSGGGYLSNEIFYRVAALRRSSGASVPMGHLHTPFMAPPTSGISTSAFVTQRDQIVATVRRILVATLPSL